MTLQQEVEILADSLQLPIIVHEGVLLQKERERKVILNNSIRLTLPLKPIKLFHGEQSGIVVRVCGDLHIISCYYAKTKKLSMYMIDSTKVDSKLEHLISSKDTLRDVVDKLGTAIVASYHYADKKWHALTLPKE